MAKVGKCYDSETINHGFNRTYTLLSVTAERANWKLDT